MRMSKMVRAYVAAAMGGLAFGFANITPAEAYTDTIKSSCLSAMDDPYMQFNKSSAPMGTLYTYYSAHEECNGALKVIRRKVTMVAGSGNGSSDACESSAGWLPNGSYNPRYEVNHQTSSAVVKGSVWDLGSHRCTTSSTSTLRTELFIHSQGGNGGSWTGTSSSPGNYKSAGCIKINQGDRTYLAGLYNRPIYGTSRTEMDVTS